MLFSMIDWTINIGNALQIITFLGATMAFFLTMRSDITSLRMDINHLKDKQESLTEAFKQLGAILTQVAVQDTRLSMLEKNLDELRHGQGYIKTLK